MHAGLPALLDMQAQGGTLQIAHPLLQISTTASMKTAIALALACLLVASPLAAASRSPSLLEVYPGSCCYLLLA